MVLFTSIGFCVLFLGLIVYLIIDAVRMKPRELKPAGAISQAELESSFKGLTEFTEKIKTDLGKLNDELKRRDLEDAALKEPIKDIDKELRLMKRRSTRTYLERLKSMGYLYMDITMPNQLSSTTDVDAVIKILTEMRESKGEKSSSDLFTIIKSRTIESQREKKGTEK